MDDTAAPAAPSSAGGNTPAPSAPASFASLDWSPEASPASDPSTPATASPEGPAAGAPEVTPGDDRSPLIPRARFDEVVNARKAAEAQAKALHEALGGIPPGTARELLQGLAKHAKDPIGFFIEQARSHQNPAELLDRLSSAIRESHGDVIRSYFGRKLAEMKGQSEPQPDLQYEVDGKTVLLYSADQQVKREAWLRRQIEQGFDQRVQPLQRDAEARANAAAAAEETQRLQQWVTTTVEDSLSWVGMDNTANRQALGQWLETQTQGRDVSGHELERLIDKGYRTVVIPRLTSSAESKLLDSLQQKAHASSGVNPGSAAPTTTKRVTSFTDKSLQWS